MIELFAIVNLLDTTLRWNTQWGWVSPEGEMEFDQYTAEEMDSVMLPVDGYWVEV